MRKNNCIFIITVVVEETRRRAILTVCHKDFHDLNNGATQSVITIPYYVFHSCKTNKTHIRSIVVDGVACKLVLHKWAQMETKVDTHINPVDYQRVPAPKQMKLTASPIGIGQKPDKNNSLQGELLLFQKLSASLSVLWRVVLWVLWLIVIIAILKTVWRPINIGILLVTRIIH